MTAGDLLDELAGRGVLLTTTPEGDIRCRGKLYANDVTRLKACKSDLLTLIVSRESRETLSPASPPSPGGVNPHKSAPLTGYTMGDSVVFAAVPHAKRRPPEFIERYLAAAADLGLVARWSREFGYISLHDPTTGEWHDLRTEDAPDWAKREAFKRKELYRDGNRKAFRLTARDIEDIWEAERALEPEGIVEDHLLEEGLGVEY